MCYFSVEIRRYFESVVLQPHYVSVADAAVSVASEFFIGWKSDASDFKLSVFPSST